MCLVDKTQTFSVSRCFLGATDRTGALPVNHYFLRLPPVALSALKRKKRYEKQLQQIDGTLSTIEMQREALEGANTNTAVLQTMGEAAKALKAAHKHMYVTPRRCGGVGRMCVCVFPRAAVAGSGRRGMYGRDVSASRHASVRRSPGRRRGDPLLRK